MVKILFLINTLQGGGAEKVLIDTVNNLNSKKYDITVMTLIDEGIYKNSLNKNIRYRSIPSFKNKFLKRIGSYFLQILLPPRLVYSIFIPKKYDVEIAFLEGVPTKIIAASTNKTSRKYAWVHTDLEKYYGQQKIFKNLIENINCYKRFDKIFCVSQEAKAAFCRKFNINEKVCTQHNVIDDGAIKLKAEQKISHEFANKFRMISVGRLVHQKGFDRLIDVCRMLSDEGHDFELIIIGEGKERESLENSIREFNLEDKVKLLGFQNNPYKYMKHCDLFVCSSRVEGFSTVATEATILGLPIVTTACAGMTDLLGNSKFGLIAENNTVGLFQGLKKVIEDKNLYNYYKKQAKNRGKYFCKKDRINEMEKIIDSVNDRVSDN